jgi:hypothetical protein
MTKRNTAVHATSTLLLQLRLTKVFVELVPVVHAFQRRTIEGQLPIKFHESGWFTHAFLWLPKREQIPTWRSARPLFTNVLDRNLLSLVGKREED